MAGTRIQPDFKAFASLRNEPGKDGADATREADRARRDEADGEIPSISEYQDPRDRLDHERHRLFAEARERAAATGHHASAGGPGPAADK